MPATYGSAAYTAKTYGKRTVKRKFPVEPEPEVGPGVQKRRKVEPYDSERTRFPSTDVEDSPPRKPKVTTTYGTPRKANPKNASPSPPPTASTPASNLASKPPAKLARDLSRIFASVTPSVTPSGSPTKLAKRMLARSKTESSIESNQSSINVHDKRTPSLPNLSSSSPPKLSEIASSSRDTLNILPLPAPASIPGATRTYAGKSRSFLMPVSSTNPSVGGQNDDEVDDEFTRESYSSLRARWGMDTSEDDPCMYNSPSPSKKGKSASATPNASPSKGANGKGKGKVSHSTRAPPLPPGMMNPLKSITELRNKGESRRFLDEAGYLFEGMDKSQGISLRRASAVEITTKLCDSVFARKTKAADFYGRIWDLFVEAGAGKGEDKILDTCLAFFAALVTRDPASLTDLAQYIPLPPSPTVPSDAPTTLTSSRKAKEKQKQSDNEEGENRSFIDTLFFLLVTFDSDPLELVAPNSGYGGAELRKIAIGKKEKVMLSTIYNTISTKSFLFPSHTQISTPLLITHVLQSLSPSVFSPKNLPTLLNSLRAVLTNSSSHSSLASALQLKWYDAAAELSFVSIHNHLRLLDLYLLGQWSSLSKQTHSQSQLQTEGLDDEGEEAQWKETNEEELSKAREEGLTDDLVALGVCAEIRMNNVDVDDAATKCMEFILRVLVSLTHGDESWARKVVENEFALGWLMRVVSRAGKAVSSFNPSSKPNFNSSQLGSPRNDATGKVEDKGEEDVTEEEVNEVSNANRAEPERRVQALDRLCLALGLLTNLIQVLDEAKGALRETYLDPSCPLKKRACLRACACPKPISALDVLVQLYTRLLPRPSSPTPALARVKKEEEELPRKDSNDGDADADADADSAFLRGHIAVLFGLLMRGSVVNQKQILGCLPPPSSSITPSSSPNKARAKRMPVGQDRAKLSRLVEQAREFVVFFAYVNQNRDRDHAGEDGWEGGRKTGDGREEESSSRVAKEIVRFLEKLRDEAV